MNKNKMNNLFIILYYDKIEAILKFSLLFILYFIKNYLNLGFI